MKEIDSNINIIGGGLIGSIVAYSLSKLGYKISILEKKKYYKNERFKDNRTVAISEGTKEFLNTIGLWKEIALYCEPIKNIKVVDRKLLNQLDFDNIRRKSNLGYIIKNNYLLDIVYSKIANKNNIKIFNNTTINNFKIIEDKIITITNKIKVNSDLNIAADGKSSFVRKFFKTFTYSKNYQKSALVLIFTHSKNHNGTAFELFYKNGPLAILPMKKNNKNFCSSIVWTNDTEYLKNLLQMNEEKLTSILNSETQNLVGTVKKIMSKQIFPITAHLNSKFYEKKTVFVGDSAHSFHPIAGQGWNLGIRDISNLFNLVDNYNRLGLEIGSDLFCKKYHDENFFNAYRLYQVTDKLDSVFKLNIPVINTVRSSGIKFLNKNKKLKNIISDFAMGIN